MMGIGTGIVDILTLLITGIFLLVIVSYYVLLFVRVRKPDYHAAFKSVTIIIPAHNEERYIAACIESVLAARFKGKKQIIVVDDKSKDATANIVRRFAKRGVTLQGVTLLRNKEHSGKSASINAALRIAKGDIIAIVDADSTIERDALEELAREVARKGCGGATGIMKVQNRSRFLNPWVHIELIYNSLLRSILSKVNANIVTPGPLSMYRADALRQIGGFSTKGFSEDMDVAVRLIRAGYTIGFCERAVASTNMPDTVKQFFRQRTRMARGLIFLLKRHMRINSTIIDLYTFPLFLFTYVQAVIMGTITIYKIASGYMIYFADKGVYMSWGVVKFFFEWLSIVGFAKWTFSVLSGAEALTALSALGILSTLLSYPLYLYAILKYDKRFDLLHLIPFVFMFPFWLLIMGVYTLCVPEVFRSTQYNRWKKNE